MVEYKHLFNLVGSKLADGVNTFETQLAKDIYKNLASKDEYNISDIYCGIYQVEVDGNAPPYKRLYVENIQYSKFAHDPKYLQPVPHYHSTVIYTLMVKDFEGNYYCESELNNGTVKCITSNQGFPHGINLGDEMLGKKFFLTDAICHWAVETSVKKMVTLG